MPKRPNNKALAKLGDDRVLSEMACRVFSAGFVWSVIDKKWPGFEEAFLEFNPKRLLFQPAEFWEKLASDKRIVRNPQKIKSGARQRQVRERGRSRTRQLRQVLGQLARPTTRSACSDVFARRGSRLGGFSGQYLLRFLGWDAFVLSGDVLLCLRDSGRAAERDRHVHEGSQGGASAAQCLGQESDLPVTHVSRICALSIGENYDVARLKEVMQL